MKINDLIFNPRKICGVLYQLNKNNFYVHPFLIISSSYTMRIFCQSFWRPKRFSVKVFRPKLFGHRFSSPGQNKQVRTKQSKMLPKKKSKNPCYSRRSPQSFLSNLNRTLIQSNFGRKTFWTKLYTVLMLRTLTLRFPLNFLTLRRQAL